MAQHDRQTNADRSLAYSSAGYIKIDANELDLAEEYFSRALELDAKSDLADAGRSDAAFAKGDYEKAIALKPELSAMLQQTFEVTYVERGACM
ncbi:hypothetical protein [Rhizobium sp. AB2/73]|uniref:hypothetical protein n=1 Tax=Rhizobium sp. AB2/73 TaxID=2795216 RepID=UPI000DDE9923|nr:hypothetical protein [Rhizobium sp. AB2/73]QYA16473.1 hypothetical protein J5284_26485 [Rhizobium sp. AB2/73]UEQ85016.1 hypothetical protein I8E17_27815 [Rhizobium sp. AB2/73]